MATLYSSIISARSRRLRTIGLVLLVSVLLLALYGAFVFMPRLRENRVTLRARITYQDPKSPPIPFQSLTPDQQAKVKRLAKAQLLFEYAYWSFCGALIIALLVVAWMDAREVAKNYLREQVTLLAETGKRAKADSSPEIKK